MISVMNAEQEQISDAEQSQLSLWIGNVLFIMNILIGGIGSVMVYRYGKVAQKLFQDFGVKLPKMTELTISPVYSCLLPIMTLLAFAIYFFPLEENKKITAQASTLFVMLFIAGVFVVTILPVVHNIIERLE